MTNLPSNVPYEGQALWEARRLDLLLTSILSRILSEAGMPSRDFHTQSSLSLKSDGSDTDSWIFKEANG